jgi:hypothetical protein
VKRVSLLQELPVISPVFKALMVYSIVELTEQLQTLSPHAEQRQTMKQRLGVQYVRVGVMMTESLGFELGPFCLGLMADQLIF